MTLQIQIYTTLSNTRIPLTPSDRSLVFPEIYSYSSSSGISYFSYFVLLPLPFLFASPSKLSSSIPIPPTSAFPPSPPFLALPPFPRRQPALPTLPPPCPCRVFGPAEVVQVRQSHLLAFIAPGRPM